MELTLLCSLLARSVAIHAERYQVPAAKHSILDWGCLPVGDHGVSGQGQESMDHKQHPRHVIVPKSQMKFDFGTTSRRNYLVQRWGSPFVCNGDTNT